MTISNNNLARTSSFTHVDVNRNNVGENRKTEAASSQVALANSEYNVNENENRNTLVNTLLFLFMRNPEMFSEMDIALDSLGLFGEELPDACVNEWNALVKNRNNPNRKQFTNFIRNHQEVARQMIGAIRG